MRLRRFFHWENEAKAQYNDCSNEHGGMRNMGPAISSLRISITLSLCLHPDLAGGLSWLLKAHTSSRESWGVSRPSATSHAVYAGIWRTRNWMGEIMGRAVGRDDRDQPASWIRCAGFMMPYAHRLITKKFVRKEARLLESAGSGKSRSA